MTKRVDIEYAKRKLDEFAALPAAEQFRQMIAWGTINEKGEVLMGLEEAKALEAAQKARANGAAPPPPGEAASR